MDVLLPHIERGALIVVGPFPKHYTDNTFQEITTEGWTALAAKTRMEELLNTSARNIVLDAVLAPNDTLARAVIEVLMADERYQDRLPVVTGQDAEFNSMMSIKNGNQYSTVFKDTAKLAKAAIMLADQIIKGETIDIPESIIASGDLLEIGNTGAGYVIAFLLDPILITKDNIDIPVNAGFYTDDEAIQLMR